MFRNRLLKILALLMVLNILIIPLTTFTPQQQNKYKVYAAEGIVDIRFFNAVISMIGITAAGLATMSPSFTIPEVDLVEMKNNFAQSLEADAVKKQSWMAAQTDYLAGGIAKTMGAVELAKIGVNDIYNQFLDYLKTKFIINDPNYVKMAPSGFLVKNYGDFEVIVNYDLSQATKDVLTKFIIYQNQGNGYYQSELSYPIYITGSLDFYDKTTNAFIPNFVKSFSSLGSTQKVYIGLNSITGERNIEIYSRYFNSIGIPISNNYITGNVNYNSTGDIVNASESNKSLLPTIPWIDTTVPIGTVVTPAISAPYAGSVPIDVPITAPIDPPIDEPVDPPVEDNIAGTIAAILAGLTPIAGFLEYILAGQVSLTDTIEAGITGVIDGIGDIAGTLTGGITSSLTDIQSSISTLFDPPTETLNLDKLKNLNSVLFTKFPFSIPFDFVSMISAFSSDPVAPVITIPFDMSDFGGQYTEVKMDLSDYNNIAAVARQIGFIGFVFFMLFNTRKLIWK